MLGAGCDSKQDICKLLEQELAAGRAGIWRAADALERHHQAILQTFAEHVPKPPAAADAHRKASCPGSAVGQVVVTTPSPRSSDAVSLVSLDEEVSPQLSTRSLEKEQTEAEQSTQEWQKSDYIFNIVHKRKRLEAIQKLELAADVGPGPSEDSLIPTAKGPSCGCRERFDAFVRSHAFEMFFAILIVLNTTMICLELQYKGTVNGATIDYPGNSFASFRNQNDDLDRAFFVTAMCFGLMFCIELLLQFASYGPQEWAKKLWNWFDFFVVLLWLLNLAKAVDIGIDIMILRLVRVARCVRIVRLFKGFSAVDSVHVFIASIRASLGVMACSLCILAVIVVMFALCLTQETEHYILDPSKDLQIRQDLYVYTGTVWRSIVTLLEMTLSLGGWVRPYRFLMENIGGWIPVLCIIYRMTIGFSILQVIGAVFIQQTMKTAANDEELMMRQRKKATAKFSRDVRRVFQEVDQDNDGMVNWPEFDKATTSDKMQIWLSALEIDTSETHELFQLLDGGDREIDYDEFIYGARRLKGPARSIDVIGMMQELKRMAQHLNSLNQGASKPESRARAAFGQLQGQLRRFETQHLPGIPAA